MAASAVCMPLGRAEEVFVRGVQEDRKELQMRRLRVRRP